MNLAVLMLYQISFQMIAVGASRGVSQVDFIGPGPASVLPNILKDGQNLQSFSQQGGAIQHDFLPQYGQMQGRRFFKRLVFW